MNSLQLSNDGELYSIQTDHSEELTVLDCVFHSGHFV